jgi:hypothetical protein
MKILLGFNPLNSLNSEHTFKIFLEIPSLLCQLNLNLGGASGFSSSSPPSSYPSSSNAANTFDGLKLRSRLNMSKLSFSIAPSAKDTVFV